MNIVIKDEKISDFRDLVNSNSSFVYKKYSDNNGKNHWNLICSCMDWISVSISFLQNAPEPNKNIDIRVMDMFSLISSIDLVSESIAQLHRVFINHQTLPFAGERRCFSERIFDEDDNSYFKSIRACFGAHPVNLNQSTSKRFASWPFDSHINNGELTVHLYSNKVGEDDLVMNINSNELIDFLTIRYNYLDVIAQQIMRLYERFRSDLAKELIETKSDPLEQLYVLRIESEKRFDNDHYNGAIDDLIMIFEAEIPQEDIKVMASNYKKLLEMLIGEIKENLQVMNIVDLENSSLLYPRSDLSRELNYEISKFYTWVHGNKGDPLIDYYLDRFNKATDFNFSFNINDSIGCLFIKVNLMLLN